MFGLQTETNKRMNNTLYAQRQRGTSMPSILIVENDDDNRQMLKFLLEMWKFCVLEARDGIEALMIAEKERPDLILMDVKLPLLDGFDATRQIRESAEINRVPVVFISGCADKDARRAASAAGGNDYLVKPVNFQELEHTLRKYI